MRHEFFVFDTENSHGHGERLEMIRKTYILNYECLNLC